jgi:hypothetical protein
MIIPEILNEKYLLQNKNINKLYFNYECECEILSNCSINILTSHIFQFDIFVYKYDFLCLIMNLLNLDKEEIKNISEITNNLYKMINIYISNPFFREFYNKHFLQIITEFCNDKLYFTNDILISNSFFLIDGKTKEYINQQENYIDLMKSDGYISCIVEIIFSNKVFVARFIYKE